MPAPGPAFACPTDWPAACPLNLALAVLRVLGAV